MTDGRDAFSLLGPEVRAALSERGFSVPTEPQRRAIPTLVEGGNALIIAPTGTGKTETAMLPVFDDLVENPPEGFGALYITPLRALNRDMRDRLEWWGETLDLDVDVRHGDTTQYQRSKQADDPPDVLVTTPETLQAMLSGKKLREGLADVSAVVVDEVHELAASKRGAQLSIALERLAELAGEFRRIGLSATVGDPEEVGRFLTGGTVPAIVEVDVASLVAFTVTTPEIASDDSSLARELVTTDAVASHVRTMIELVETHESTLIFVNTRQTAEGIGSRFRRLGAPIGVHHGSLSKDARIEVEDDFKAGAIDALLCTSSMELGIDVGRIDHVVQYHSPRQVNRLLQRVGRAGHRMDEVSHGTIVTTSEDDAMEALVIARRAKAGLVEPAALHHGSLDTLANQIVGIVMDFGDVSARRAYEIVTRAYPFRDVTEDAFRGVVRELSRNRVVWLDEEKDTLSKSSGTWQYYYANLSMIPDEATYDVHDLASGRQVGTLDERFVVNFASPGAVFVQRGEMWRIADVDEDEEKVSVNPIEDPTGEVPSWIGAEIPVPFDVAQEVGELREVVASQFANGADLDAVVADVTSRYPTDAHTARSGLEVIERHVESDTLVPTQDRVVVEYEGRRIVVNACFGHNVNETMGRLLSALIGQRTGSSVGLDVDPYRIELEVPPKIRGSDIVDVLTDTDPNHVGPLIELSLKRSSALQFRLAQVAGKFGALSTDSGGFSRHRLVAALEDTPIYDEAVREVFHEDLAVEATANVLRSIQAGNIEVVATHGRTPLGTSGRSSGTELLVPENADASVIETVKKRIQNDRVLLFCLHCQDWERKQPVRRVPENPQCPLCESTRIAALNPWADEVVSAVKATEKDDEQEKMTQRAYRAASLVQAHGKRAVIALAARGVGPHNAARIINKFREDEAGFYRDIIAEETRYARTKSFWD